MERIVKWNIEWKSLEISIEMVFSWKEKMSLDKDHVKRSTWKNNQKNNDISMVPLRHSGHTYIAPFVEENIQLKNQLIGFGILSCLSPS